jgi:hypothetical protein
MTDENEALEVLNHSVQRKKEREVALEKLLEGLRDLLKYTSQNQFVSSVEIQIKSRKLCVLLNAYELLK